MPKIEPISPQSSIYALQGAFPQAGSAQHSRDTLGVSEMATPENWRPERPTLTPPSPSQSVDWRFLAVMEQSRKISDGVLDSLILQLEGVKAQVRDTSSELLQKLREASEKAATSNFWSTLSKIAACFVSAISMVFGVSFLTAGGSTLIGGAMIASGVLSLANFALSETGGWNWVADVISHDNEETKKKIAAYLPMAVGIAAAGISLTSAVYGATAGAFKLTEHTVSALLAMVSLFKAGTDFGKGIAEGKLIHARADIQLLQAKEAMQQEMFPEIFEEIKYFMNESRTAKAQAKDAIRTLIQSNKNNL